MGKSIKSMLPTVDYEDLELKPDDIIRIINKYCECTTPEYKLKYDERWKRILKERKKEEEEAKMIFSTARSDYKCSQCRETINKGDRYLNKPKFRYGADKYCLPCIRKEFGVGE